MKEAAGGLLGKGRAADLEEEGQGENTVGAEIDEDLF